MSRRFATKEAHDKFRKKLSQKKSDRANGDSDNEACVAPIKRRLIKRSEKLSSPSTSSQDSVVASPVLSELAKLQTDKDLLGYDDDDGFVVEDEVLYYDPENPDEFVDDKLSRKQRRIVEAEVARDAYSYLDNMSNIREKFSMHSALNHLQTISVDMETAIENLFYDEGRVDEFIEKFDSTLLGGTLTAFKSKTSCKTIETCLSHGIWKLDNLNSKMVDLCVLCGNKRQACKQRLITTNRFVVGSVGEDCAARWFILEQVYALRHEILSLYGCRSDAHDAKHYDQKIVGLKELCIRTLQELQNRYVVEEEEKNVD